VKNQYVFFERWLLINYLDELFGNIELANCPKETKLKNEGNSNLSFEIIYLGFLERMQEELE
jgi:hypothetical protein